MTLDLENLRVAATGSGQELVRGVGFRLARGRVLALVGASGSGKSLTCLGLQDALPPGALRTGGAVRFDGREMSGAELRGRVVATILQAPRSAFNPVRTMRAHARETLAALGVAGDAEAQIRAAMAEVGLTDPAILDLHPFQMSGGMLQRAMIALALLSGAPFLIADEPTTDLDLPAQAAILDLLEGLVRRRGLGILLVTHDMAVVARLADEVAVMEAGRIVETGDVEALFDRPAHACTQALLAAHVALYAGGAA